MTLLVSDAVCWPFPENPKVVAALWHLGALTVCQINGAKEERQTTNNSSDAPQQFFFYLDQKFGYAGAKGD